MRVAFLNYTFFRFQSSSVKFQGRIMAKFIRKLILHPRLLHFLIEKNQVFNDLLHFCLLGYKFPMVLKTVRRGLSWKLRHFSWVVCSMIHSVSKWEFLFSCLFKSNWVTISVVSFVCQTGVDHQWKITFSAIQNTC